MGLYSACLFLVSCLLLFLRKKSLKEDRQSLSFCLFFLQSMSCLFTYSKMRLLVSKTGLDWSRYPWAEAPPLLYSQVSLVSASSPYSRQDCIYHRLLNRTYCSSTARYLAGPSPHHGPSTINTITGNMRRFSPRSLEERPEN